MHANLGRVSTIARGIAAFVAFLAVPLVARAQSADSARALIVDSVLRAYRLPGLTGQTGSPVSIAPSSVRYYGRERAHDGARTIVVPVQPTDGLASALECSMPVVVGTGNAISRAVMDSMAANPPGSPVPMPTRRYPCVNPRRK